MYNCPTFFLFWKCLADMSYWTNLYLTVADNELHFFTISNLNYTVFVSLAHMLIADLYSKFPIIRKLTNMSSSTVIIHLKGIFDEHGIPERLISDNGPQYSAEEFRVFSVRYGFDHVTSSPLYPRSNGFIERTVQTVKKLFTKAKEGDAWRPSFGDVVSQDNTN